MVIWKMLVLSPASVELSLRKPRVFSACVETKNRRYRNQDTSVAEVDKNENCGYFNSAVG
jgi:hypothetical protein